MAQIADEVFTMLVLACGLLTTSTIGFGVAWLRARERAIRAETHVAPAARAADSAGDPRVEQLEQLVAQMAGDVEQLTQGQQFVSQLLGEGGRREHPPGLPSAVSAG